MLRTVGRRLFPLHLAPIDDFFLFDDRPAYPMTFVSNLFFTGEFDRTALLEALREAIDRHPLFQALIGRAKQNKLCWIDAGDREPFMDWGPIDEPIEFPNGEAIDLRRELGLRVWIRQGGGRARLVLQFHHACSDGTGAHRFIGDLLAAYGTRTAVGDELPTAVDYDPQLLKARRHKLADLSTVRSTIRLASTAFAQLFHVMGSRVAPLAVPVQRSTEELTPDGFPGVVSHTFAVDQLKSLRDAATRYGVMLNDLLTAEMFQALRAWNQEHHGARRRALRIMMPSDMREVADYAMPAANMTSYNFVHRKQKECDRPEELLRSIREETQAIKHDQRGRYFVEALMASDYVPGLLKFITSDRRCLATATLSNMGDPTRRFVATFPRRGGRLVCGNLILDNMLGVSPLRPLTRAAISIVTLYRQLSINVRCDPHCMGVPESRALLQTYVRRLEQHLA